ncbi:MAG: hypothetical protein HY901_25520 [Deltaproteobacteria bacterium]|nr:hypothetical protein [Deltaproteobacteria bacterium]
MAFAYYERLSEPEKLIYQISDAVPALRLHEPSTLAPLAEAIRQALLREDLREIRRAVGVLSDGVVSRLGVEQVQTEVLAVRPHWPGAELHGLYSRRSGEPPIISVWMRTARRAQVVAFRTFLRTLLHELCHHLDLELLGLPLSLHTQGFFKRESSLFHQLVPDARRPVG